MKKLVLSLIAISFSFNLLNAQTCLPDGITFTTQSQVDSFAINYPDCIEILGDVLIGSNLSEQSDINNLNSLNSIQVIGGDFYILCNPLLENLEGLENLASIGGSLSVEGIPLLVNIDGLENLASIEGNLTIMTGCYPTSVLENIGGLIGLTSINGYIALNNLDSLSSLQGLQNIDPEGIWYLSIVDNLILSYCEVASICNFLELTTPGESFASNSIGCNSEEEVLLACNPVGVSEINPKKTFSIYPNPNTGFVTIDLGTIENASVNLFNINGQVIYHQENISRPSYHFEIQGAPGIYILEMSTKDQIQYFKMVKQ